MSKRFSAADVASHKTASDLWIIVDEDVYDLTNFQEEHPGGKKILSRVAGKDASKQFWKYHNDSILKKYQKLQVGSLDTKAAPPAPPAAAAPEQKAEKKKDVVKPEANSGVIAPQPTEAAAEEAEPFDAYGDLIPYADPSWYQTYHSPYFNDTHVALRDEVRQWVEEKLMPNVTEWDEAKKVPDEIYQEMGERGYLAGMLGIHFPKELTDRRVQCVPPEKWDHFHEMIITDELSRTGSGGLVWGLIGGYGIGAPPLFKFGKKELVQRIGPDILSGKKRICLAITEPDAGSDVANLGCDGHTCSSVRYSFVCSRKLQQHTFLPHPALTTMAAEFDASTLTAEQLPELLKNDIAVKVAGIDVDGVLRGKLMAKKKFLSIANDGFGFCSVIFGWDMHDQTYFKELAISNKENGYRDLLAIPDLTSFRRIPWEDNIPFFLISFHDPDTKETLSACPRSLLKRAVDRLKENGYGAMAGAEYEFYQFRAPQSHDGSEKNTSSTAVFLRENPVNSLPSLTEGMFGYSITRPVHNQEYYYGIFNTCAQFGCGIEGWHTESGPGVFEAALEFGEIQAMADKASLFKLVVKSLGSKFGITPCFMAKPREGLPGNSGHMHVSIVDKEGKNLFYRGEEDKNAPYSDIRYLSDLGRHFLAGLIDGLPDIMPILAPNVNSYKRLVENFWAPVTVSWGLEHRAASIRLISPPTSSGKATRFEVRVPGADTNPHFVLAAILALGWRGIEKKMEIGIPPLGKGEDVGGEADKGERLAKSLKEATERFMRKESVAREVFGDQFVDHFGGTRQHEIRLWDEAVTDWEVRRYIETV